MSNDAGLDETRAPWMTPWVTQLVRTYEAHASTRMAGLPVCNPALRVQAVSFQPWAEACAQAESPEPGLLGALITPWFLNLVWRSPAAPWQGLAVGASRELDIGGIKLGFIGTHEPELGPLACCSLISPMFQFNDQATAVATAEAAMDTLRQAAREAQAAQRAASSVEPAMPARRGFLFGRSAARPAP